MIQSRNDLRDGKRGEAVNGTVDQEARSSVGRGTRQARYGARPRRDTEEANAEVIRGVERQCARREEDIRGEKREREMRQRNAR